MAGILLAGDSATNSLEFYNPATDTFIAIPTSRLALPEGCASFSCPQQMFFLEDTMILVVINNHSSKPPSPYLPLAAQGLGKFGQHGPPSPRSTTSATHGSGQPNFYQDRGCKWHRYESLHWLYDRFFSVW
jgi:hypothetical protein